ncbi:MAG: DNA repair protein RadA [Sphaerochaetaceae bacterium]|jgi:DNA repair protein RadA/Sms|nr:DNA repair protein RadA [Sphaerochaetaceae bacterium]NLY08040.1 DNA repair protein RadA [Spirochaetales bacterium]
MKESQVFACNNCGYQSPKWLGRCPECGSWNSFEEETVAQVSSSGKGSSIPTPNSSEKAQRLSDVVIEPEFRFSTGMDEFDRVIGGGLNKGSSVLLGGEPGIGKSTLALQVLEKVSHTYKVLYICGEESSAQIKQRAIRLGLDMDNIIIYCDTRLDQIIQTIRKEKPTLMVVDSMQTLASAEVPSVAGSVNQIRACSLEIIMAAKQISSAVILIGHVTKEGLLAGPKVVEHLVDTVLYFDQASSGVRLVRASKNRFGSIDEIGIFRMTEKGLEPVKDSQGLFISDRTQKDIPSGIAFTAVVEGSRTFLVEIQALVVNAKSGYSRVYSDKIESARVTRIAAVLERHAGVQLSDKDIYVNVAGGVRLVDVAIDLPLALALFSATSSIPISGGTVSFGELSLAGEVRPVSFLEKRAKAASELGFRKAVIPRMKNPGKTLEYCVCSTVAQALDAFRMTNSK